MADIACIGWGSLVYSPGDLPCLGHWQMDGPMLPVEFARQSENGRITLVICDAVPRVPACWCLLDVPDVVAARRALGVREYPKATPQWIEKNVGYWDADGRTVFGLEGQTIAAWAGARRLHGAVWTNLPCKFNGKSGTMPTGAQVVAYLEGLRGETRDQAEAYVRQAPAQVDTPYRRLIAQKIGWTPAA